jgi:hypothetical protein
LLPYGARSRRSTIEESTSAYGGIGWIVWACRFDDAVKASMAEHLEATIVNA